MDWAMGEIIFTLHKILDELDISPTKLSVESKVRYPTIKGMLDNESKRITVSNLSSILNALNMIAREKGIKRKITISDIIEYVE